LNPGNFVSRENRLEVLRCLHDELVWCERRGSFCKHQRSRVGGGLRRPIFFDKSDASQPEACI
ncbi:MAG: hypothetical protein ABWZ64_16710, partial [Xanthobacteraceae bacterium]